MNDRHKETPEIYTTQELYTETEETYRDFEILKCSSGKFMARLQNDWTHRVFGYSIGEVKSRVDEWHGSNVGVSGDQQRI